jgi:hypothetical protein
MFTGPRSIRNFPQIIGIRPFMPASHGSFGSFWIHSALLVGATEEEIA